MNLEQRPDVINLADVGQRHTDHKRPTTRLAPDEPLMGQADQGLAHGYPADAESLSECQLPEVFAGLELPTDDCEAQARRNELPEVSSFNDV